LVKSAVANADKINKKIIGGKAMKKMTYQAPELNVVCFADEDIYMDILSASGDGGTTWQADPNRGDGWNDPWAM
jgi:hypothetical protein